MRAKDQLIMFFAVFPASPLKNCLLRMLGWKIGSGSKVSSILAMRLPNVTLGDHVIVQQFSVFRDVSIEIDNSSVLGKWNWVSAARPLKGLPEFKGLLKVGKNCGINSRNYFDVSGGVTFGDFSDLAGIRSTFITHQIDSVTNKQTCSPIEIGEHTMVCSNSTFVPGGTRIGNRSIIAMGSVVTRGTYGDSSLFAGNPAKFKKVVTGKWFGRNEGPSGL